MGVETGEIVGLLGRNGSGKTCLMNIIYGSLKCRYRTLKIHEVYTTHAFRRPGLMRYLPQSGYIPPWITVKTAFRENAMDFERFTEWFPEMERCYRQKTGTLSAGARRIMEIYLVVAAPVWFALMDEPFSQIMPLHIQRIKELMLTEKRNKGILVTDHMYRQILEMSDRIYLLANKSSYLMKNDGDLARLGYV
ncbi:MAG: ATP-binding cassette domain-containing protein [Rikenellaceae bacterium]|nr:ATP-binding cassette domain-containing protein [Rikenellaceae bacterium]